MNVKGIAAVVMISCTVSAAAGEEFSRVSPVVKAVRKAGGCVVNISTERIEKRIDPFYEFRRRFFRGPFDEFFDRYYEPETYTVRSLGSGVIIDGAGYIVTNEHVIHGASKIIVTLARDKHPYEAELVSSVPEKDLALLKIDAGRPLKAVEMGDSDTLMIGETAIALGNPFGLENTVTTGVVSATNRSVYSEGNLVFSGLIQTDAAINPGNSGGALLDINGRLIGINTAIKQDAEGIGFAIAVNEVRKVLNDLLSVERVCDLWLGVKVAEAAGGVRVVDVQEGSPAAEAGVKRGSIVSGVEGEAVKGCLDFHKKVLRAARKGRTLRLTVDGTGVRVRLKKYGESLLAVRCGFRGVAFTPWMARRLGLPLVTKGILITRVTPRSPADGIGLEIGDLVVAFGGRRVSRIRDITEVLEKTPPGGEVDVVVLRRGRMLKGRLETAGEKREGGR